MAKNSNYSIAVDVDLNLKDIENQLKSKKYGITFDTDGLKNSRNDIDSTRSSIENLGRSVDDTILTYQQFRQVLDSVIDVTAKLYEQVKQLDSAQTEFKKVSELNGRALDEYTSKLAKIGQEVGRTGKPNRSEPVCCDGKAA